MAALGSVMLRFAPGGKSITAFGSPDSRLSLPRRDRFAGNSAGREISGALRTGKHRARGVAGCKRTCIVGGRALIELGRPFDVAKRCCGDGEDGEDSGAGDRVTQPRLEDGANGATEQEADPGIALASDSSRESTRAW